MRRWSVPPWRAIDIREVVEVRVREQPLATFDFLDDGEEGPVEGDRHTDRISRSSEGLKHRRPLGIPLAVAQSGPSTARSRSSRTCRGSRCGRPRAATKRARSGSAIRSYLKETPGHMAPDRRSRSRKLEPERVYHADGLFHHLACHFARLRGLKRLARRPIRDDR